MSEQMREEFAAWYLAEITESYGKGCRAKAERNLAWVRQDGSFADPMLRLACLAWQASREDMPSGFTAVDMTTAAAQWFRDGAASVVVILPPRMIDRSVDKYADGFNYAMGIAKKAIIAAGGSVKK